MEVGAFVGMKIWGLALALGLAAPGLADELIGARGFVAHTYVKRTKGHAFRFSSPQLLAPDLYQLVQLDGGRRLIYDPLCQCKDNDGLSAEILSVTGTSRLAVAHVRLRFDGIATVQHVTLMVTRSAAGWKITDIRSSQIPSLKAWLAQKSGGVPIAQR